MSRCDRCCQNVIVRRCDCALCHLAQTLRVTSHRRPAGASRGATRRCRHTDAQRTIDDNAEHADQVKQAYLADALAAVAAGKPVEVKETKALGCTIKYYES